MISGLIRVLLALGGVVAGWFVATNSPNFQIAQAAAGLLIFALLVFVLALWPRSWTRQLNGPGR